LDHVANYPVLRKLGEGATSEVFLCQDPFRNREVAVKRIFPEALRDPSRGRLFRKLFFTEASLAGKLNHPHIVDIYDAVVEPDRSYLVMEYVPGTTLETHADVSTLLPVSKVVEIIFKCIRALEYAWRHGVIHRDIKPGNILLSESGETKVSDFGASFQQRMQETTQIAGVGSPAYMSPEQIRMEQLTHQTDIYSLGVTMYRLLTGRLPFVASTQAALMYAILNTDPPRPATLRPELPGLLDAVVMKAMQRDPAARYQSWLDFGKDLSQAFASLRMAGASVSESERFTKLRDFPFFAEFNDVALWELIRIGAWKTFGPQAALIREGETGDSFYFLIEGEVDVTLSGKALATIKPGRCFGELVFFADKAQRRTTTVAARGPLTVLEVKAEAMRAATDALQSAFTKACMRILIERLVYSNERLAQAA
jgi:serine/threonine protein kinase